MSVFVSYPRNSAEECRTLIENLKASGVRVYWDDQLDIGKWEDQLQQQLRVCKAFIVIITPEVVERRASFVHTEITHALENETPIILPIFVGQLNFESPSLKRLEQFQAIQVDRLSTLFTLEKWERYKASIKNFLVDGAFPDGLGRVTGYRDMESAGWPVLGPDAISQQAYALAVVLFEGELPLVVEDAARSIESLISTQLRDETDEEKNAKVRSLVATPASTLLASIGAERVRISAGRHANREVVRFKELDHRVRLLDFIWKELPIVRELMIDWIDGLMQQTVSQDLAIRIARALSYLAQSDLEGLDYAILSRISRGPPSPNQLAIVSVLLAVGYDNRANHPTIRRVIERVFSRDYISLRGALVRGHVPAINVALGALADRTPAPGLELLRRLRPLLRDNGPHGDRLRHAILTSPVFSGRSIASISQEEFDGRYDADFLMRDGGMTTAEPSADPISQTAETGYVSKAPHDDLEVSTAPQESVQEQAAMDEEEETKSLGPAIGGWATAVFLKGLAEWIDEKRAPDKVIERQEPLWLFFSAFLRMPLWKRVDVYGLSLEELVFDISKRSDPIRQAIEQAFIRGAVASPQRGSSYKAPLHLQRVITSFAQQRTQGAQPQAPEGDPFLVFTRRVHQRIRAREPKLGDFVYRKALKYLSGADLKYIEG